jgi:hypothetical protein
LWEPGDGGAGEDLETRTRAAADAYAELHAATRAAMADPLGTDGEELSAAAWKAHRAMGAAGLLGRPEAEVLALVRRFHPGLDGR